MTRIEQAKQYCMDAHESIHQKRKYSGEPYYLHPWAVAELVASRTSDEDIIIAAYLHDIIEDVSPINDQYTAGDILRKFGPKVLKIVMELTHKYTHDTYELLARRERKVLEFYRLSQASEEAKLIKRADQFHNLSEIPKDEDFYKVFSAEAEILASFIGKW